MDILGDAGGGTMTRKKKPKFPPFPAGKRFTPTAPTVADPWVQAQERARALSQPYLDFLAKQQSTDEQSVRNAAAQRTADLNATYAAQKPLIDKSYDQAIQANAAIEDAVSKHLKTAGAGAVSDLGAMLRQIGAPDTEATNLEGIYQGAGGAEYATGTSDIQNLVSDKAATSATLSRQQIADLSSVGKDLNTAITEMAKQYGVEKGDVLKALPEQVSSLYELSQSLAADKRDYAEKTREYNKEFDYRAASDLQDRMAERQKLALETKLTAQQTMDEQTYKVWAKRFDAHQKALDRKARKDIAAAQRASSAQSKVAGIDLTGPANRKYITVPGPDGTPTLVENPNYVPPVKKTSKSATKSSSDSVDTAGSAKRNRAYEAARSAVFNTSTGRVRDTVAYAQDSNIKAQNLINAALKGQGVDPYSKAGSQIRQSLWAFLDGKPAGTGDTAGKFVDPRKDDPRFKRKKKRK